MAQLDLKRIRYFLKLVETLNFSRAAKELKVTQSGLTKAISQLERDIGGTLLRREGKNTHLTQLGETMIDHFVQIDRSAMRAQETARRMVHGEMPTIRLGVMCTIGPQIISEFLARYRKAAPDLEVILRDLTRAELPRTLLHGEVDLALVGANIEETNKFRHVELYSEKMMLACATTHRFAHRPSVSMADVAQEPYVDRLQCEFRETFLDHANQQDFTPEFIARTDREEWAQSLIANGAGVSMLPEHSIIAPGITKVPVGDFVLMRHVSMAIPFGRSDTEPVRNFLNAVRNYDWPT